MRRPLDIERLHIERLHIDCDGFFGSVEQQVHPHLRGKPVSVVPFKDTTHTCVIACSREAKLRGVKNVMGLGGARECCPDMIFVPQSPDLPPRAQCAAVGYHCRHSDRNAPRCASVAGFPVTRRKCGSCSGPNLVRPIWMKSNAACIARTACAGAGFASRSSMTIKTKDLSAGWCDAKPIDRGL